MCYSLLIFNKFLRCREILDLFKNQFVNFTDNPLHLEMVCETDGIEVMQKLDLISIYDKFLIKKITHGLATCLQIDIRSSNLLPSRNNIYTILTRCAVALIVENKDASTGLKDEEVDYINQSGVATVVVNTRSLEFVHRTFAEFLTARHFIELCLGPLPGSIKVDMAKVQLNMKNLPGYLISLQTTCFIDDFCGHNMDKEMSANVLSFITAKREELFDLICFHNMPYLYTFLRNRQVFNDEEVNEWILQSEDNGLSLYLDAGDELAKLLCDAEEKRTGQKCKWPKRQF